MSRIALLKNNFIFIVFGALVIFLSLYIISAQMDVSVGHLLLKILDSVYMKFILFVSVLATFCCWQFKGLITGLEAVTVTAFILLISMVINILSSIYLN